MRGWRVAVLPGLALALVVSHVTLVGIGWMPSSTGLLWLVLVEILTVGVVLLRWRRTCGEAGRLWLLLALAMMFQLLSGTFNWASTLLSGQAAVVVANISWALSGIYLLPLIFMIARTFSRDMTRMVHVLDSLLVTCTGVMVVSMIYYMAVTPPKLLAVHASELVFLADAVNYSLAGMLTLRAFGSTTALRRYAYLASAFFMWSHVIAISAINRVGEGPWPWWLFLLMDASLMVLLSVSMAQVPRWLRRMRPSPHTVTVIDGFAPIVLTVSVLALGIAVSRLNFGLGMFVSVLSVLFYGLRMAYLHSRDQDRERLASLSNMRLQERLGTDPLTGIANRMTLDVRLPNMLEAARASGSSCSVLMIDIDFFKQYNDHFGHLAGDRCLQEVALALSQGLLRSSDLIVRYGGEEFVAVLPDTTERAARMVADRLVDAVAREHIEHPHSPYKRVTISVGVATCMTCSSGQSNDLLEMADRALYRAKNGGRNATYSAGGSQRDWMDMPKSPDRRAARQ